ncbi:cupin domain-containing protein [Legionella spiritensis]|uniref:Cupin n=1 Tax=Legionella spiritensis TaxID=452 RepID=A0A0W0Z7X6_LEGSP|nr:cupin domain-containing protein [Legionella spiritensis]KTD65223.1 cupin [Legionella spiritensis]SNV39601.1 cupin [Legionella spiritensis]
MINFQGLDVNEFLTHYWQKKPLVIRKAIPAFVSPINGDELAGLALEDEVESRLVMYVADKKPFWHLKRGPFNEDDFKTLPATHWTLLVQGVDRFIPEVASLLDHFDFIPQWRVDDVMVSYAVEQGGVGPHYDHYDVFLFQAQGRRKWSLTSRHCNPDNYLPDVTLRIMDNFLVEEEFILEEGDMLYLPPHIGHNGVSLSPDCITYSFGYRSYPARELWEGFGEYLAEHHIRHLYQDPCWAGMKGASEIPVQAIDQAKNTLLTLLSDDKKLREWFGCFVTRLDEQAEQLLSLEEEGSADMEQFVMQLHKSKGFIRNSLCRFAYQQSDTSPNVILFVNGQCRDSVGADRELVRLVADHRFVTKTQLAPFLDHQENRLFLFKLWQSQWIFFQESSLKNK